MFKKFCPRCKKFSYSATRGSKWICPTCGYDLTDKPVLPLEATDRGGGYRPCLLTLLRSEVYRGGNADKSAKK